MNQTQISNIQQQKDAEEAYQFQDYRVLIKQVQTKLYLNFLISIVLRNQNSQEISEALLNQELKENIEKLDKLPGLDVNFKFKYSFIKAIISILKKNQKQRTKQEIYQLMKEFQKTLFLEKFNYSIQYEICKMLTYQYLLTDENPLQLDSTYILLTGEIYQLTNEEGKLQAIPEGKSFGEDNLNQQPSSINTNYLVKQSCNLAVLDNISYKKVLSKFQTFFQNKFKEFIERQNLFQKLTVIADVPLFDQTQYFHLKEIFQHTTEITFHINQTVFKQGDIANSFYVIKKGEFKLRFNIKTKNQLQENQIKVPKDTDMMKEKYFKFNNNNKDKAIRTIEVINQFYQLQTQLRILFLENILILAKKNSQPKRKADKQKLSVLQKSVFYGLLIKKLHIKSYLDKHVKQKIYLRQLRKTRLNKLDFNPTITTTNLSLEENQFNQFQEQDIQQKLHKSIPEFQDSISNKFETMKKFQDFKSNVLGYNQSPQAVNICGQFGSKLSYKLSQQIKDIKSKTQANSHQAYLIVQLPDRKEVNKQYSLECQKHIKSKTKSKYLLSQSALNTSAQLQNNFSLSGQMIQQSNTQRIQQDISSTQSNNKIISKYNRSLLPLKYQAQQLFKSNGDYFQKARGVKRSSNLMPYEEYNLLPQVLVPIGYAKIQQTKKTFPF